MYRKIGEGGRISSRRMGRSRKGVVSEEEAKREKDGKKQRERERQRKYSGRKIITPCAQKITELASRPCN